MQLLPKKPEPPTEIHESTKAFIEGFIDQGWSKQDVINRVEQIPDEHYRQLALKYVLKLLPDKRQYHE